MANQLGWILEWAVFMYYGTNGSWNPFRFASVPSSTRKLVEYRGEKIVKSSYRQVSELCRQGYMAPAWKMKKNGRNYSCFCPTFAGKCVDPKTLQYGKPLTFKTRIINFIGKIIQA